MKLITASTILIGVAAKKQTRSPEKTGAGLRGPHTQRERQVSLLGSGGGFIDLFGGNNGVVENLCGDTCTDSEACSSFASLSAILDPTSVFVRACDARCFPKSTLSACETVCDNKDAETEAVVSTAVARTGFLDFEAAKESMCSDCKFYECCLGDGGEAADEPTGYDACKVHLADDLEDQAMGNSLLVEIVDGVTEALESISEALGDGLADAFELNLTNSLEDAEDGAVDAQFDSVLSQIFDSFTDAMEGAAQTLESIDIPSWDFNLTDWGDGAVWTGIDGASGASVFGQVVGSFDCPATCTEPSLCDSVILGVSDRTILEDACNSDCLPTPETCDEICGNVDGPEFLAPIADMACKSCQFFQCCGEEQGNETKFNTCQVHLPAEVDLLSNIDWVGGGFKDWIDSMDWSGMAEPLGLSGTFESLQALFDESMANFDVSPLTCNPDTCPISGLCEMNADLASVDFDEICSEDAFFQCSQGLEDMCTSECSGRSNNFAPFCSLCSIATCCNTSKKDNKKFLDCVSDSLFEMTEGITDEDSIGSTADIPVEDILVEDTPSEANGSPASASEANDFSVVSSGNAAESSVDESPPESSGSIEDAPSESSGISTSTPAEASLSGPLASPIAPLELNVAQANVAEASRTNLPDSGSDASRVSMSIALASIAALFFASL